ncbi:hypothetical protein, partial [Puia sp.]|uniref:hypothetical protein n=1 Tax=Puia sp. TaxID=2045100 RepID=UPI002F42BDB3
IHHSQPNEIDFPKSQFISKYEADTGSFRDTFAILLPAGTYRANWYEPVSGASLAIADIRQPEQGIRVFRTPLFTTDIALRLVRK